MIATKKDTSPKKKITAPVREKVLTAEGWRRMMLKQARPAPKKTKK